jgi:hypothetical protein
MSTLKMRETKNPGVIQPLDPDSLYWLPLLALPTIEKTVYAKHDALADLVKTRNQRSNVLGVALWHIWKCRMKEIYDNTYTFIPQKTESSLNNALSKPLWTY